MPEVPVFRLVAGIDMERYSARGDARLRLRLAFHYGLLIDAPFGPAGSAPVIVSRLLDAGLLRQALAAAAEANLVLIVSQTLYDSIVMSGFGGLAPSAYHQVRVVAPEKGFDQLALRRGRAFRCDPRLRQRVPGRKPVRGGH
jgi:hypothetical protein